MHYSSLSTPPSKHKNQCWFNVGPAGTNFEPTLIQSLVSAGQMMGVIVTLVMMCQ